MLRLIEGGLFAGGHELIKSEIASVCEGGGRCFLIVPEQQTVLAEREFVDVLPSSLALLFEATNFTRFSDTVFRKVGGIAGKTCGSAERAIIMWRTLCELSPYLELTSETEVNSGQVCAYLSAMKEVLAMGIGPDELGEAEKRLVKSEGRLGAKLRDLAKIMTLYKKILTESFSDADDRLLTLEARLRESGYRLLSDTKIFIDGFTSFTEPQYKVIAALAASCEVTVNLILPKHNQSLFEYAETATAHRRLLRLAALEDIDTKLVKLDSADDKSPHLIREICNNIWRSNPNFDKNCLQSTDSFRIFDAETPYDECDFVASDIKRRVMGGARYSDFAVICRKIEGYSGIIDTAFDKAGIPIFISLRQDISSYELIKLIYTAFAAVCNGYRRSDVIAYSKCQLSGLDRDLADELELYCETWQINGNRFTDGITWNMNPDGYTAARAKGTDEKLLRLDAARHTLIDPLVSFEAELSGETALSHATALYNLMKRLRIEEKLAMRAIRQRARGEKDAAADTEKLYKTVCDGLDSICELMADAKLTGEDFLRLLKITFAEADIGRIPSYYDKVTAGSADVMRILGKKHIYIMGATFGSFPAVAADDGYLTAKDRRALTEAGLNLPEETDTRSARELYYFTRAMASGEESVTLLYHRRDAGFKPQLPSEAIGRINEITEGAIVPVRLSELSAMERIYSPEFALEHTRTAEDSAESIRLALTEAGYGERLRASELPLKNSELKLSKASLALLYGESIPLSQSKIDKFVGCPMSYFCSYNLKLSPEKRAEFDASNIGTFIHAVLENFFRELKREGKDASLIDEAKRDELIISVARRYVDSTLKDTGDKSARLNAQIERLRRSARPVVDSLCQEFSQSGFKPIFFELEIGRGNPSSPSPAIFKTDDGRKISINGIIDRVDAYQADGDVYVRVVDYKTGKKIFSPRDIEKGKNLQMFLYLKSITETESQEFKDWLGASPNGRIIPAGVIYMKADIGDAKVSRPNADDARLAVEAMQKRIGMVLDDESSLSAMNQNYLPYTVDSKTGKASAKTAENLYTAYGWEEINQKISEVIGSIGSRMLSGDIRALPLEQGGQSSACRYCDFKAVCRNAKQGLDN